MWLHLRQLTELTPIVRDYFLTTTSLLYSLDRRLISAGLEIAVDIAVHINCATIHCNTCELMDGGYKATKRSDRATCDDDAADVTSTPVYVHADSLLKKT